MAGALVTSTAAPVIGRDYRREVFIMNHVARLQWRILSLPGTVLGLLLAVSVQAQQLLPNLQAFPAHDIEIGENFGGVLELRFAATTNNAGDGPLELIAGGVSQGQQFVYQRVYAQDDSFEDFLAGRFVWHQGHSHFHLEDYARYTLQSLKGNSKRSSSKTSFCLLDTELVDASLPGAPKNAVYTQCGNFFQGLSVGWADVYGAQLPGQEIDLSRLKDGDYRLMIEVDPKDRLMETDESDNSSCVLLRISVTAQTVDILNPNGCDEGSEPPGESVVVSSISPNSAGEGDVVNVVIGGSGFADGMDVSFDNGRGSKPVASNVVIVDSTQITATVTVKRRGGKGGDNVWDLMVGSGVLVDAFTVLP